MVKSLKNLLLCNQKANDLETWYVASGARVLPSLFVLLWVDLDLFYRKVKFGPLCFCMGKRLNNGFLCSAHRGHRGFGLSVKIFVQVRISRPANGSKLIFHIRMYLYETSRNIQEP